MGGKGLRSYDDLAGRNEAGFEGTQQC